MPDGNSRARGRVRPVGRIAYVDRCYLRHDLATVHIEDRGLQFADAIYEVVGVFGGKIFDEEEHLDRLERSLRELQLPMPMERRALRLVIREVARRNRLLEMEAEILKRPSAYFARENILNMTFTSSRRTARTCRWRRVVA